MVKFYDSIEPDLHEWIMKQPMFVVASAPLNGKHVSCPPKGLPDTSFSILSPNLCAYVDATGSGIETVANVLENGRITFMFNSYEVMPRILRIYGTGRIIEYTEPDFEQWLARMNKTKKGAPRAIIAVDVWKVQTSCGFGVPRLALKQDPKDESKQIPYLADRDTLGHWGNKIVSNNTAEDYRVKYNVRSLDGLPGLKKARRDNGERLWYGDVKARVQRQSGPVYTIIVALCSVVLTMISLLVMGMLHAPDRLSQQLL